MIVLTILMTAKPRQRVEEVVNRPVFFDLPMSPSTQHRNVIFADDFSRFACPRIRPTTGITHRQKGQCDNGQQRDRWFQSFFGSELRTLNFATRLQALVIFLKRGIRFTQVIRRFPLRSFPRSRGQLARFVGRGGRRACRGVLKFSG